MNKEYAINIKNEPLGKRKKLYNLMSEAGEPFVNNTRLLDFAPRFSHLVFDGYRWICTLTPGDWYTYISLDKAIKKSEKVTKVKKFTPKDLKTGMICEFDEGPLGIVISNSILTFHGWMSLADFNEDFSSDKYSRALVKIAELANNKNSYNRDLRSLLSTIKNIADHKVLWERKVSEVSVTDAGSSKRTLIIRKERPSIIKIGCSEYTKEEAYDAIMQKYANPLTALEYMQKVKECFDKAKREFK